MESRNDIFYEWDEYSEYSDLDTWDYHLFDEIEYYDNNDNDNDNDNDNNNQSENFQSYENNNEYNESELEESNNLPPINNDLDFIILQNSLFFDSFNDGFYNDINIPTIIIQEVCINRRLCNRCPLCRTFINYWGIEVLGNWEIDRNIDRTCAICLEDMNYRHIRLNCGHRFCRDCTLDPIQYLH